MNSVSLSRGLLLMIAGVWLFTRTFKGGLANKLAAKVA